MGSVISGTLAHAILELSTNYPKTQYCAPIVGTGKIKSGGRTKKCGGLMYHKLTEAGSYQVMDLISRYGTQNDKERRLVVTGLAWYVGCALKGR